MAKPKPSTVPAPADPVPEIELSGAAATLYEEVSQRWTLDPVAARILRLACEALQRAHACAAVTAREGLTIPDRLGRAKAHPLALLERDHRAAAANCLQKLGLNLE
jgi:hypothetical protein